MILGLSTLGDANITRLFADPPQVWRVITPDDPEAYARESARSARPSFLGKIFGRGRATEPARPSEPLVLAEGEGQGVDLDKAWHAIHYLLTGTAWEGAEPLNFLVLGGRPVGDIDVGYGPARALSAAETRTVHGALAQLTDDELRARFDPADMMKKQIYPEIWERDPAEDDTLAYVMEHLQTLRDSLAEAVERHYGLLVYIT